MNWISVEDCLPYDEIREASGEARVLTIDVDGFVYILLFSNKGLFYQDTGLHHPIKNSPTVNRFNTIAVIKERLKHVTHLIIMLICLFIIFN